MGSCIAWTDLRQGRPVPSVHWLVVEKAARGQGLGRALCTQVLDRLWQDAPAPIYLHTQPWSWKAILLYVSLGFRLQQTDTFAAYTNQYPQAMETLRAVLSPEQLARLRQASDP